MSDIVWAILGGYVWFKHALSAISLPMLIIYAWTLWRFRAKTPFNSPFFSIAFHTAIVDIVAVVHAYIFFVFPRLRIVFQRISSTFFLILPEFCRRGILWDAQYFVDHKWLGSFAVNGIMVLTTAQTLGVLILSANRAFPVMCATNYDRVNHLLPTSACS